VRGLDCRPLVIKFGGTSVGSGARFVRAAKIAAGAAQHSPAAVVVSAMSGTTDTLLGFARTTFGDDGRTSTGATREGTVAELYRTLAERHLEAARVAVLEEHLPEVEERLLSLLGRLAKVAEQPFESGAARSDAVVQFGERLSAEILAGAIRSLGVSAAVVAGDPIATDANFGEAEVDAEETRARAAKYAAPILDSGAVAVVPGYVGRAPDGSVTTLGRGGSDLSATVLGRALGAREVRIMTDVDGVLSADPRLVPEATTLPCLSYREAAVFAGLGAKVLHPKTMEPAVESGMEVFVGNTFDPHATGTRISVGESGPGVRCVALRRGIKLEVPCSRGHRSEAAVVVCVGSPGRKDAAHGRRLLRKEGITLLHSGVTSAGLVFVVGAHAAEAALRLLHEGLVTPAREPAGEVA
jgi:aspartate kinase